MPDPIKIESTVVDLSQRFKRTTAIVASPVDATETIIASLTIADDLVVGQGIFLEGWAAFVIGTNGVSDRLRIRRTNAAGATQADTDVLTGGVAAAAKIAQDVMGFDTGPTLPGQVYVLTLTVGSATTASTVSSVLLRASII